MTEDKVIPHDIQEDANKLFLRPNRSYYNTDTEYDYAMVIFRGTIGNVMHYYIKGRMEERAKGINLSDIDKYLIEHKDCTQEERETIIEWLDNYKNNKK